MMESEGVLLPLIHKHVMMPWNNNPRRGDCCARSEDINDGYYCNTCNFFVHKNCVEDCSDSIEHPFHSKHTLRLRSEPYNYCYRCDLCGRRIKDLCYRCKTCDFNMHLYCAKYLPRDVIDISEMHHHKLILLKNKKWFHCDAKCGYDGSFGLPFECHECDLAFHVDCVWHPVQTTHPAELNHSCHSLHPLKLLTGKPPNYSDGKCRLCGKKIGYLFYHCSSCNFTLDMRCAFNPPRISRLDLKTHDHQLTLLPRLDSFTCNACGLKGDRSPYVCLQCDFIIHQCCLVLPRLININRHDHRIFRTSLLGVQQSECEVCHKKVAWIWGGYSCQMCVSYVVHSRCATREDLWNGKELEGVPEETEDIDPYVVIDDITIQHFSHKEHYLRLHVNGVVYEDNHPVSFKSFYGCMECDFILHKNCAECPKKKRHVLHNERLTLITRDGDATNYFECCACYRVSNGFRYQHGDKRFDVLCSSISEPFVHPSHPSHPLYYTPADAKPKRCNGCYEMFHCNIYTSNNSQFSTLSCIEDDCRYDICFGCATLPQVVKHRVDDHPLLLCYGEKANGKFWCDICEKETNPEKWFYTCKDHRLSLHIKCVLGYCTGHMPRSRVNISSILRYEMVLNNSMSRPFCGWCMKRCIFPIIFKMCDTSSYFCSFHCADISLIF